MSDLLPPPPNEDVKLRPEQVVRLLNAKSAELEHYVLGQGHASLGTIAGLAADVALIASLLADHIEDCTSDRRQRFQEAMEWTLTEHGETLRRLGEQGKTPMPVRDLLDDIKVKAVSKGDAWKWVITNMPNEATDALAKFVSINHHYRGAGWEDCLEVLLDSDAQLEVTEPMADAMPEWGALHAAITMTLIYASRVFATDMTTEQRITAVRATIANNGPLVI